MQETPVYEKIGRNYVHTRRADPSWQRRIHAALADARTLLNVGAGAGSYEPDNLDVIALEPSATMIRQRPNKQCARILWDRGTVTVRRSEL